MTRSPLILVIVSCVLAGNVIAMWLNNLGSVSVSKSVVVSTRPQAEQLEKILSTNSDNIVTLDAVTLGDDVNFSFEATNVMSETMNVGRIAPSCGCMQVSPESMTVLPGASLAFYGTILSSLPSGGRVTVPFDVELTGVTSNVTKWCRFQIIANYVASLTVTHNIPTDNSHFIGVQEEVGDISVENRCGYEVDVECELARGKHVSLDPARLKLQPGEKKSIKVSVQGESNERVCINVRRPKTSELHPVEFSTSFEDGIIVSPRVLILGIGNKGGDFKDESGRYSLKVVWSAISGNTVVVSSVPSFLRKYQHRTVSEGEIELVFEEIRQDHDKRIGDDKRGGNDTIVLQLVAENGMVLQSTNIPIVGGGMRQ